VLLHRIEPAQVVGGTGRPDGMAVMLMAMGLGRGWGLRQARRSQQGQHQQQGQRSPPMGKTAAHSTTESICTAALSSYIVAMAAKVSAMLRNASTTTGSNLRPEFSMMNSQATAWLQGAL